MAFQPDNFWNSTTMNDVGQFIFPQDDYRGAQDNLNFSGGAGTLNTPTLPIINPLATLSLGASLDDNNDVSTGELEDLLSMSFDQGILQIEEPLILFENIIEDFENPLAETQADVDDIDQLMNTDEQQTVAEIEDNLRNAMVEYTDDINLQGIITAMNRHGPPTLRMRTQPVARHRFRYRSDGIRYFEQSRVHPMAVTLPILDGCLTKSYQSFWIQATIITTRNNPHTRTFVHQHEMFYNGDNAQQNGLHSFRIPLTENEIRSRTKKFRHLSIIKTKLKNYTFELTPFDPLIVDDHTQHYQPANADTMTKVKKAKRFDREYHTNTYQIVCQLMIKQKDQWYLTDLYCETHVIRDN